LWAFITYLAQPITHMTDNRHAVHPEDFRTYDTQKVRKAFLIENIFLDNTITHTYSHHDRLIVGGIKPKDKPLKLETIDELKADFFLERRELGIINVGASATVNVDGKTYALAYKEALYIGRGVRDVTFMPSSSGETLLYYNSAPAHAMYPTRLITHAEAETVELGSADTANHRTIRKLLVNSVLPTCQLQMGLTELNVGSVWNTMPPHTHDRRMEAYFYFEVQENQMVCHFMGTPQETRHVWMKNNQAVISPPWSIHSGAGTRNYSFIWGMAGENLDYSDMDQVKVADLK
jgi:4-deoxy-L-threo-5-hexosulose-uronate ketol-isomerase